jgi:hypothetical protein
MEEMSEQCSWIMYDDEVSIVNDVGPWIAKMTVMAIRFPGLSKDLALVTDNGIGVHLPLHREFGSHIG